MTLVPGDDLPSAPGIEALGPLGSLAMHEGKLVRIPLTSLSRTDRIVPVEDVGLFREAARLVADGLVLAGRHRYLTEKELITDWLESALGPPRKVCPLSQRTWVVTFESAVCLALDGAFTVACATSDLLGAFLDHPTTRNQHLSPARYAYEGAPTEPDFGRLLGSTICPDRPGWETFALHETDRGCAVRGVLAEVFETRFEMKRGGVIATVPRHPERFARARAFGEWQPGLRNTAGLCALLEAHQASDSLTREVLAADELVGGFRGQRGIEILSPWAMWGILKASSCDRSDPSPRSIAYNESTWLLGWAFIEQQHANVYVDDAGHVWTCWQDPATGFEEFYRVGETVEGWFNRQLFLLEHGYAWESMCRVEEALPPGLRLREDLSDATAQVFEGGDAVWLVHELGIRRMSRHVATAAEVVALVERFR